MRNKGRDVALGVDLVTYAAELGPAVLYAMGNSLVANTERKAKQLGFEQRLKATDLAGTLINPNGTMAGGVTKCATAAS